MKKIPSTLFAVLLFIGISCSRSNGGGGATNTPAPNPTVTPPFVPVAFSKSQILGKWNETKFVVVYTKNNTPNDTFLSTRPGFQDFMEDSVHVVSWANSTTDANNHLIINFDKEADLTWGYTVGSGYFVAHLSLMTDTVYVLGISPTQLELVDNRRLVGGDPHYYIHSFYQR